MLVGTITDEPLSILEQRGGGKDGGGLVHVQVVGLQHMQEEGNGVDISG